MCGIVGFVNFKQEVNLKILKLGMDGLAHRGPDGEGMWVSNCRKVALGHRRLSVLDLSNNSRQPMCSQDGRFTIVFNGEIYNFTDLRKELESYGHVFATSGDTEILLKAFIVWGEDCLSKLNGMFAFVIFDSGSYNIEPSLFFARDRAGEKPLFYSYCETKFSFASELKGISYGCNVNLQALNYYLALGYVPEDLCLFEGVNKLPPAHFGRLNLKTFKLSIHQYWSLPENQPTDFFDGYTLAEEAGKLIEDSVRLRLVADVPVGVLLSGGLDSSIVVAAAARVSSTPVQTFTIALPGSSLNEAQHAEKVASFFSTQHHVLSLGKHSLNFLDVFEKLIDEPIADSSIIPSWLVYGLARKHVKVALGGDGGDELFGGYSDYTKSISDAKRFGLLPKALMKTAAAVAASLPAGIRGRNRLASLRGGFFQQLIWGQPYFDSHLRRRILKSSVVAELDSQLESPEQFLLDLFYKGGDPVDSMTRTHFGSILPDDFLVKVDRTSMAQSLEVRAPFLDHRLIEFAFSKVPSLWKVHDGESRRLQRLLAKQWLPRDLNINRKQGFSIPINEWLRNEGEQRLMARMEGLPDEIDFDEVHHLVRGHLQGRSNGGRLFALIMLALAMRNARR